jgi:hypothetical protein
MSVYTHEIFGHVLSVLRVATYEEGLALINRNELANGTAIFTRDGGAAPAVPARRRGQHGGRQRAYYSFGGWKSSLFGDAHMHGPKGSTSTPGARSSPHAGPTLRRRVWISASRGPAELSNLVERGLLPAPRLTVHHELRR